MARAWHSVRTPRAVVAWALALAACGADEAVTLRITSWQSPEENAIDAVEFRSFEAAHPGVRIVNDPVSNSAEYREKVLTSVGAGSPPDVFLLDGIDVAAFAARDVVLNLQPFAERVGVQLGLFFPQVVEPFRVGGKLLAFPKGFSPMVYYYNRALFADAGLAPPKNGWTHDEFLAAVRALTRDTDGDGVVDQWGTVLDRRLYAWQAWIWSAGADVLTADGTRATGAIDQPAAERARLRAAAKRVWRRTRLRTAPVLQWAAGVDDERPLDDPAHAPLSRAGARATGCGVGAARAGS
jgi:multiple sugar transport system substrate-binding protein